MDGKSWLTNELVEALSHKFCFAYPDMLGHGMSDKPVEAGLYEQKTSVKNNMINQ